MVMALESVRSGQADAVLSAGNTGALMAGGLLLLGRLSGISRPALLAELPSFEEYGVVILDVGANMDAKPEQLFQYAQIGKIYSQEVLGRSDPRIVLLHVGSEDNKGNAQIKKTFQLFKENGNFNFIGNLEAKELFEDKTDILICDGFAGNVFIKAFEGISWYIFDHLLNEARRSTEISTEFVSFLNNLYTKIDAAEYGGAFLMGLGGVCIKCHGSSRARAVTQALLQRIYPFVKNNTNAKIEEELKQVLLESTE
jgi:glycerol-3-phosphate acyltransferase PlsX